MFPHPSPPTRTPGSEGSLVSDSAAPDPLEEPLIQACSEPTIMGTVEDDEDWDYSDDHDPNIRVIDTDAITAASKNDKPRKTEQKTDTVWSSTTKATNATASLPSQPTPPQDNLPQTQHPEPLPPPLPTCP